uniref:HDC08756 n=1 Tax=Drosophila melanogaster TaxID=7227 RepID=Q6ILQ6_DROME|nr:TPA_inf: HDC08756 [Drosophila melanogaster]
MEFADFQTLSNNPLEFCRHNEFARISVQGCRKCHRSRIHAQILWEGCISYAGSSSYSPPYTPFPLLLFPLLILAGGLAALLDSSKQPENQHPSSCWSKLQQSQDSGKLCDAKAVAEFSKMFQEVSKRVI